MNPNMMVTCPYNNAHRMKESRLQIHITRCRQDHLNDCHFVCPFNSTHVLPNQEKAYHLLRCPDKAPLDRKLAESMEKNNPFKGRTAVPSYSEPIVVEPSELWDVDDDFESGGACAAVAKEPPPGAIVEPKPFSKPASRRQLYQELHQMPTEAESKFTIKAPIPPPEPRQPKQPSEAARLQNLEKRNAEFQNVGLGRGKSSTSRIAANIFSPEIESNGATEAEPSSNITAAPGLGCWGTGRGFANHAASNGAIPRGPSYSAAISGINNLSLGRGRARPSAAVSQTGFSEDDFPALGLGRGASRNPQKQNDGGTGFW